MNQFLKKQNETVIVIDAGHGGLGGGADDGAMYNGVTERYINMETAKAMYEELSKYDDVKVYLTHDDVNVAMTLKERAEFAKSVNADFLISIHYNASESHQFYGSEVWIPSIGRYYAEGYRLADRVIEQFRNMGLHIRGIKTRVGDGNDEYYGIIRECEWRGITSVIIEHCHVDNMNDYRFFNSQEDYIEFGRADATATAQCFGLKSSILGVDYSDYPNVQVEAPAGRVYQDTTPPDRCELSLAKEIAGDGSVAFIIEGFDSQSCISYYSYSFDGGNTYSDLFEWRDSDGDNKESIIICNISENEADLVVRVYNNYNLFTDSGILKLRAINGIEPEPESIVETNPIGENQSDGQLQKEVESVTETIPETDTTKPADTQTEAITETDIIGELPTISQSLQTTECQTTGKGTAGEKSWYSSGGSIAAVITLVTVGVSALVYKFFHKS